MPPIVDFTSAFPWVASGFIAGLLVFWLLRALSGVDRRRIEALNASTSELDESRRAHASLSQNFAQIEGERVRLVNETSQLSQRAALVPQYELQISELRQSEAARAAAAEAATSQLVSLRQDAEQATGTAKYYESEFARLLEAHQELSKNAGSNASMVTKLQSDYAVASREAGEAARLRSELASAKAEIELLKADIESGKASHARYQDEVMRLRRENEQALVAVETAKSAGSGSADEISKLKAELATAHKRADSSDEVLKLNAEIARLKPLEIERSQLANDVARLNAELEAATSHSAASFAGVGDTQHLHDEIANLRFAAAESDSLAAEVTRLRAELNAAPNHDEVNASIHRMQEEITRLKASANAEAASYADEIERIKSESAKLNSALVSARADERNAAMELHTAKNDLQQARIAMEETSRLVAERHAEIDQLKSRLANMPADADNYRRFKEALEAANRIAAGLPEKS